MESPRNTASTFAPLAASSRLACRYLHEPSPICQQTRRLQSRRSVGPLDDAGYQKLNSLKPQKLKLRATATTAGDERVITVQIANNGKEAALGTKLTLVDHMGVRILPALYSDNYLTVLPGEPRIVEIRYPAKLGTRATINVRGWNVQETRCACRGRGARPTYPISIRNPGSSRSARRRRR